MAARRFSHVDVFTAVPHLGNFRLAAAPTVEPAAELTRSGEALHRAVTPEPHPDAAEGGLAYIWDVAAAEPPRPEAPIHTAALSDCAHLLARRAQRADAATRPRPRQTRADQTDRRGPIRRWTLEYYRHDILPRLAMVSLPDIEQVTVTLESASTFLDHRLGMSSRAKSACATKSQCEFQRRTSNARRSTSRAIGRRRDAPLSIDPSVRARGRARCAPIDG
jgi:hypothetical protein